MREPTKWLDVAGADWDTTTQFVRKIGPRPVTADTSLPGGILRPEHSRDAIQQIVAASPQIAKLKYAMEHTSFGPLAF